MPAAHTLIKKRSMEDEQESTKAIGSFSIEDNGGTKSVEIQFSVKKTGAAGTGRGYMVFALLGKNNEIVYKWDEGLTVAAELDGVHTKEKNDTIQLDQWDQAVTTAFRVDAGQDSSGLPASAKNILDLVNEGVLPLLGRLKINESAEFQGWIFDKIQ